MNVLHVLVHPDPSSDSSTMKLANAFFGTLMEAGIDDVTNLSLYQDKPPFLTAEALRYFWKPVADPGYIPSKQEETSANYAHKHMGDIRDADAIVITTPVWINSAPAILKAWMDQVFVPGNLFEIENGIVKPTHHIKSVVLLASSAEAYKENDPRDALVPLVRGIFAYIGIDDVQVAWADGQDERRYGPDAIKQRLESALEYAGELAEDMAATLMAPPAEA
ncbi:MAG: NAD(P)H-dependent oxidoreductase [Kiritimatiellae bacterium]|nr:NAD(P)H-dependent oxidoreductase [Kiritimatiellia bacterium]